MNYNKSPSLGLPHLWSLQAKLKISQRSDKGPVTIDNLHLTRFTHEEIEQAEGELTRWEIERKRAAP